MIRFMQKEKGAISIFLAAILIPMMAVASIYIDTSRVKVAKMVVSSSGDLVLNTALSNYDNVLKDMYGLFAMSQSEKDLFDNLEEYYTKSVKSMGLSDEDTSTFVGQIMSSLGLVGETGTVGDLLNIELVTDDGGILKTDERRSLANPYMMKKQMVDFMKYRFIIGVGMSFISSLQGFKGLSEQQQVFEKRQEYYEEQKKVIEDCEAAWKEISKYNKSGMTVSNLEKLDNEMHGAVENYRYITENFVKDYYSSKNRENGGNDNKDYFSTEKLIILKKVNNEFQLTLNNEVYTTPNPYTLENPATLAQIQGFVQRTQEALTGYNNIVDTEPYTTIFMTGNGAGIYEVQRVIQFNRLNENDSSVGQFMKKMHIEYNSLRVALQSVEKSKAYYDPRLIAARDELESLNERLDELLEELADIKDSSYGAAEQKRRLREKISKLQNRDIPDKEDEIEEYEEILEKCNTILNKTDNGYGTKKFQAIANDLGTGYTRNAEVYANVVARMIETVKNDSVSKIFINNQSTSDSNKGWVAGTKSINELNRLSQYLDTQYKMLTEAEEYLETAIEHLDKVIVSLSPGGDLYEKQEEWGEAANKEVIKGTAAAEQNMGEIDSVKDFMEKSQVEELKKRLDNTLTTIQQMIEDMETCTYANVELKDIKSMTDLTKAIHQYTEKTFNFYKLSVKESDLNSLYMEAYNEYMDYNDWVLTPDWKIPTVDTKWADAKSAVLATDDACAFYKYLEKNFPDEMLELGKGVKDTDVSDSAVGDAEDTFEESKKEAEAVGEEKESSDATAVTIDDSAPSKYWKSSLRDQVVSANEAAANTERGGEEDTEGFQLSKLCEKITELVGDVSTGFRDNIYMSDYMLSMLSYDTYEREKVFELKKEDGETTTGSYLYALNLTNDDPLSTLSAEQKEKYEKQATTLTNIPINKELNVGYLSEVEYILYGENAATTKTYATILGIRTAFNTVYAFTDSEIREGARAVALAAFGVPPLTFLVPIAQGAIIIAIALAESAIDIAMLKAGMDVPLYKTKKTWVLKFSSLISNLTGEAINWAAGQAIHAANQAIDAATARLSEWLDKSSEEIENAINEGVVTINQLTVDVMASIDETVDRYVEATINQTFRIIENARTLVNDDGLIRNSKYPNGIPMNEYIIEKLNDWTEGDTEGAMGDLECIAKAEAIKYISENTDIIQEFNAILDQAKNGVEEDSLVLANIIHEQTQLLCETIKIQVNLTATTIINYKNQMVTKLQDALDNNQDQVKDVINEVITGAASNLSGSLGDIQQGSGTINTSKDSNSIASYFAFSYSDYLRLFLMVNLSFNQETALCRTADVIQNNMQKQNAGFKMQSAYTYGEISVIFKVKPLMMTFPFMSTISDGKLDDDGWYTIEYKDLMGY